MRSLLSKEYIPFGSQYYRAPSPAHSQWEVDWLAPHCVCLFQLLLFRSVAVGFARGDTGEALRSRLRREEGYLAPAGGPSGVDLRPLLVPFDAASLLGQTPVASSQCAPGSTVLVLS